MPGGIRERVYVGECVVEMVREIHRVEQETAAITQRD